MSKAWLKVVFGAFREVIWVIGVRHSTTWRKTLGTVIATFISFYALIKAGEELPVDTAYAIFVGLGNAGATVTNHFLFHTPLDIGKILFLLLLLIGIVGLKMVTGDKEGETR